MAQHHTAHLLVSFLAVLLAGDARAEGCCSKNVGVVTATAARRLQTVTVSCLASATAATCTSGGGFGFIEGGTCVGGVCAAGGTAALGSDPVLTVGPCPSRLYDGEDICLAVI